MEFGKIDERLLPQVDFRLPPDPAVTKEALQTGTGNTRIYTGFARWGQKEWIGKIYPAGTREKDFLSYYARLFNTIELNTTFYKSPTEAQVEAWRNKVGNDFLFCPKFPQIVTHIKRLSHTDEDVAQFLTAVRIFGKHLGPVFLMPDPQMGQGQKNDIAQFITGIPDDIELFLELRHPDFYTAGYDAALYRFLKQQKRGTIITDTAGRRDCVHMHLSTPEAFIRFVGNALHPTDYARIDEWVQRLKEWMHNGLEKLLFFIHQHNELDAAILMKYFTEQLNLHCGTHLKVPVILPDATLF